MPIQILPAAKTFGGEFAKQFGAGAGKGFSEEIASTQQRKKMDFENEKLGIPQGTYDPDLRKAYMVEMLKSRGKEQLFEKKQGFLGELFGGKQPQRRPIEEQLGTEKEKLSLAEIPQNLDVSQIPDEAIAQATAVDPQLGSALQRMKDVSLREKRAEQEFTLKKEKSSPEYQRQQQLATAQATADTKYNQELQSASKQHELKTQTLDRLETLNRKGVTGKPFEKLLEKFGLVALTSEGRREFAADVKNLITDIRSILGSQFSQFEFQTILNAYPSADFSQGANKAIIDNLKEFQDIRKKEFEISSQIKKENKGKLPEFFQDKVNERLQEYAQTKMADIKANTQKIMNEEYGIKPGNILMFAPDGEPMEVPMDRIDEILEKGGFFP